MRLGLFPAKFLEVALVIQVSVSLAVFQMPCARVEDTTTVLSPASTHLWQFSVPLQSRQASFLLLFLRSLHFLTWCHEAGNTGEQFKKPFYSRVIRYPWCVAPFIGRDYVPVQPNQSKFNLTQGEDRGELE